MSDAAATPPREFADFPISEAVKSALRTMGYPTPTDVQSHVVGPACAGRDLLVQSKTGSGKTTAFGIPLMERLVPGTAAAGQPLALVLLPTRELAHQVAAELTLLGAPQQMGVLPIYGGVPIGKQAAVLEAGVEIIVGTPGRLLDHIRRGNLQLTHLKMVVLDEADEMLSMGFWDDVTEMIRLSPKDRQTLLFSATLPYEVAKSAAGLMRDVIRLDLSGDDLSVDGIDNCILHVLPELPKPRQLLYLLEGESAASAIIFCNTRAETDMLAKYLTQSGFVAEPLSGSFKQKDRDRTMARIKSGELRYMVATDIAARGIDINDLSHVFNYSLPEFCEVYLHRVGRTGRIGKMGRAISLVDGRGLGTLSVLEREFGVKFIEMTLPPEADVIRARSQRIMKELAEKAAVAELGQHLNVAQDILGNADAPQVVAFLLKAYFNGQAGGDGRLRGAAAVLYEQDEASARSPATRVVVARDGGEVDEAASTEPRVRRRRRGRGEGAAERHSEPTPQTAPARQGNGIVEQGAPRRSAAPYEGSAPASVSRDAFDIIDAVDLLFPERRELAERERAAQAQERLVDRPERAPRPEGRERPVAREVTREPRKSNGDRVARAERPSAERPERGSERPGKVPAGVRADRPEGAGRHDEASTPEGTARIRVNIGFDDGFKGRGSVAKKISALAGLNEGTVTELESRRDHAILRASVEIAEMVLDRVDGAPLGKKVISVEKL